MAASYQTLPANKRHCPFCGVLIAMNLSQCPSCREAVPPVPVAYRSSPDGRRAIRRGLLFMLLAAVAYYFASGYSGYNLPFLVNPLVTVLAVIGRLAFVEYLFYPKSWPLAFFFFDGTIRWLSSLSGQAVGSLALYPATWIHGWLERRAERRRLGSKVPDTIERGDGARYELRISSCRPKGNWDKWMTVMYEERLYEIAAAELGQPPRPYLYLLRTKPESKVIRGLPRYDPNEVFQEEWP